MGQIRQIAIDTTDPALRGYVLELGGVQVGEYQRGYGSARRAFVVFEGVGACIEYGWEPPVAFTHADVDEICEGHHG